MDLYAVSALIAATALLLLAFTHMLAEISNRRLDKERVEAFGEIMKRAESMFSQSFDGKPKSNLRPVPRDGA